MNIKPPVVIIGMGQLGGVFAKGFLSIGHPVYPVIRQMDMDRIQKDIPTPAFVLVAVPENSLHGVLKKLPAGWKGKIGLLQNELLPRDWEDEGLENPTVMAVWFEKKKDMEAHVFQPTPVFGPNADCVADALKAVDIPTRIPAGRKDLDIELVKKNLYVLTINIAGLKTGGTVGALWENHPELVRNVANEVLDVQEVLTGEKYDRDEMMAFLVKAFGMAPHHNCAGRVAGERLGRLVQHADSSGVHLNAIKQIFFMNRR